MSVPLRVLAPAAGLCAAGAISLLMATPTGAQDAPGPLTVYSSLPLDGAARPQAQAIVRGARLAVEEAGGMAGGRPVRYVSLNDATRIAGYWTPERTARNAVRAAQDDSTVAYIGEFNSGASAISMPILNEAGLAQISPSNTAIGLTRSGPGAEPGEPAKYRPAGRRHFFRLAPNDRVQGGALAAAMRDRRCRRVALVDDGESYGERYGDPFPDPYAIYGYESMRLVLDAVAAVGSDRAAIIRWRRDMPLRSGAVGTYRFDRYGDTTLRSYGLYRVRRGALEWTGLVEAP